MAMDEFASRLHKTVYREKPTTKSSVTNHALGICFNLEVEQTKLFIAANLYLYDEKQKAVLKYRKDIVDYIATHPSFLTSLVPIQVYPTAPGIVQAMASASNGQGLVPWLRWQGYSGKVAIELLNHSSEVIVENGETFIFRHFSQ